MNTVKLGDGKAVKTLRDHLPEKWPEGLAFGVVGGSGLAVLEDAFTEIVEEIPWSEIEGFPTSRVPGHEGKLIFGYVGKSRIKVVLMSGRAHYYEGYDLRTVTFPIRVLSSLGIKVLIVTNAAGGLNRGYKVGDIVIMHDHINFVGLAGINPLRGEITGGGSNVELNRFVPLSDAYDLGLRHIAHRAWSKTSWTNISEGVKSDMSCRRLHEGVYACVGGPNYESRAECRMLSMLGADMVGMSTVPEIIVARHEDIRVLGISVITNNAVEDRTLAGDDPRLSNGELAHLLSSIGSRTTNHEEVLREGRKAAEAVKCLVVEIIEMARQEMNEFSDTNIDKTEVVDEGTSDSSIVETKPGNQG